MSYYRNNIADERSGSGSIAVDLNFSPDYFLKLTMTGTMSVTTSNLPQNGFLVIAAIQDASGGNTLSFGAEFMRFTTDGSQTTSANAIDMYTFYSDGTNMCQVSFGKNIT